MGVYVHAELAAPSPRDPDEFLGAGSVSGPGEQLSLKEAGDEAGGQGRGHAPTYHSRAETDDRRVLGLGIDMAFVETVLEFCFLFGIKLGLVHPGRPEEGDSELWSDKSGMGGEIK